MQGWYWDTWLTNYLVGDNREFDILKEFWAVMCIMNVLFSEH